MPIVGPLTVFMLHVCLGNVGDMTELQMTRSAFVERKIGQMCPHILPTIGYH